DFVCISPPGMDQLLVNDVLIGRDQVLVAADEGAFRFAGDRLEPVSQWYERPGSRVFHALGFDDRRRAWLAAQSGLFRLEADQTVAVSLPTGDAAVHSLEFLGGQLWAGAGGRLFAVDPASATVTEHELPLPPGTRINDIDFDAEQRLWLASAEGLVRGFPGELEHLGTREGLPNKRLLAVTHDREGLVWLAIDQGLVKVLPGPFEGYSAQTGLLSSFVRTINEDDQQRLWLGTHEGLQIVPRRDGHRDFEASTVLRREDGLPDNRVYSIAFEPPDVAWIATGQG